MADQEIITRLERPEQELPLWDRAACLPPDVIVKGGKANAQLTVVELGNIKSRLSKIEAKLPPDPRVVAQKRAMAYAEGFLQHPVEDCLMWLSFLAVCNELGLDEIRRECVARERPIMAVCRLCEWDYRRLIGMLDEWNSRGG